MSDEIITRTKLCTSSVNDGSPDGCTDVTLKLSQSEVTKLQASMISQDKPPPDIDYSVAAQFWEVAFTTTFFLWLFAKGIGEILKQVRNA